MTSGGQPGTNGLVSRWELRALIGIVVLTLLYNMVGVATVNADRSNLGLPSLGWQVWVWEMSSWAGFVVMLPLLVYATRRFRPPLMRWPGAILAHLPAMVLFSGGHIAFMLAARQLAYAIVGRSYDFFGSHPADRLLYEFRKDVLFYAAAVLILLLARALGESHVRSAEPPPVARIEVRDGARTVWLTPDEIVSAEAAGNYVELATAAGTLLHRATLASMEAVLGDGFVRIHRSRLVRRAAIREIRATPSGDFEIVMAEGRVLSGSRRYRGALNGAAAQK